MRAQLQAADALVTIERDEAEPADIAIARREGEELLKQARYEDAQDALLAAIDRGLELGYFSWHAAVNLVNCHRFLGRLDDAEATAMQLAQLYEDQPDHPIHYLLATQRGAIAADRWEVAHQPAYAHEALSWARAAYRWQVEHRGRADALRAYNLVVALLRRGLEDEARGVYRRHETDEEFLTCCREGDRAEAIAAMLRS